MLQILHPCELSHVVHQDFFNSCQHISDTNTNHIKKNNTAIAIKQHRTNFNNQASMYVLINLNYFPTS